MGPNGFYPRHGYTTIILVFYSNTIVHSIVNDISDKEVQALFSDEEWEVIAAQSTKADISLYQLDFLR